MIIKEILRKEQVEREGGEKGMKSCLGYIQFYFIKRYLVRDVK